MPCYGKQALSAISQLEIGAADLSVALAKLRLCTVVLVTERLSEAGPLLHHRLGWSFVNMSLALGNSKGGGEANGVAPVSQDSSHLLVCMNCRQEGALLNTTDARNLANLRVGGD